MRRICSRISRRTCFTLAIVAVIAACWLGNAHPGSRRTVAQPVETLPELPVFAAASEYTIRDAKVLDGDAKTPDPNAQGGSIVVPGMNHSDGGAYGQRRRWDHFVRHLHGIEPPEHNAVN